MTQATTTHDAAAPHGLTAILSAPFRAIVAAMEQVMNANTRVRQAEFLMGLSDEDLAKRGLRREDIVRHVYRDMFYV